MPFSMGVFFGLFILAESSEGNSNPKSGVERP